MLNATVPTLCPEFGYFANYQDTSRGVSSPIRGTSSHQVFGSSAPLFRRCSSPRATLTSCLISSLAFVPICSTCTSASREESRGLSPLPSACRRAISPRTAVTINCAFVSPTSRLLSISPTTSWGKRALSCCDFLLVELVDISRPFLTGGIQYATKMNTTKDLHCDSLLCKVNRISKKRPIHQFKHCKNSEAPKVIATPSGPLTNNIIGGNAMAKANSNTLAHPKFIWRFYSPRTNQRRTVIASTEAEARSRLRSPSYLFSARIRITEGVYQVLAHLHSSTGEGSSFLLPDLFADHQQAERLASAAAFDFSFPGHTGKVTCEVVEVRHA